jgi:hypothetical protein
MRGAARPTHAGEGAPGTSLGGSGAAGRAAAWRGGADGGVSGDDDAFFSVLLAAPPGQQLHAAGAADAAAEAAAERELAPHALAVGACGFMTRSFRCVDAAHPPNCGACSAPPGEADTAAFVLRGDKGATRRSAACSLRRDATPHLRPKWEKRAWYRCAHHPTSALR